MSVMPAPVPKDLIEAGHAGGIMPGYHPTLGSGYIAVGYEDNPDLRFPVAQAIYDRMRNTDGETQSVLRAFNQPILKNPNRLLTDGVRPEVVKLVETELGLDNTGQRGRAARRHHGVVWIEHKREALLSVPLGFMCHEKVWQVAPPAADQAGIVEPGAEIVHLAKLGARFPRTIQEIRVNRDGSLAGIVQAGIGWDTSGAGDGIRVVGASHARDQASDFAEVWIPARELVFYAFEREGGDWTGKSILRGSYKHWFVKDDLIKTDAIAANRNGMGIPLVYFDPDAGGTEHEALRIAQQLRAGAYAGGGIPDKKYRVTIEGFTGQVRDVLSSIKYHDQAISQAALAMFLNLGHDNGARSLGDTFVEQFRDSLQAVDDWICETVTEHVIRDLVALNFGPDEPYPVLVADEIAAEGTLTAEGVKTLVEAGVITPGPEDEAEFRRRYRLPSMPAVTVRSEPGEDDSPEGVVATVPADPGHPAIDAGDPLLTQASALVDRLAKLRAGSGGHV